MLQVIDVGKSFTLSIWNKNLEQIYSDDYPQNRFKASISWVEFSIPDIIVVSKFYIHIYAPSNIMLGADRSVTNEHSNITSRLPYDTFKIRNDWPYKNGLCQYKENTNWMIRVVGTYLEPENQ